MPIYRVVGAVSGSKYLGEFEADTPEEAEDMALNSEQACVCLCHQCADECSDPEIYEVFLEEVSEEETETKLKRKRSKKGDPT